MDSSKQRAAVQWAAGLILLAVTMVAYLPAMDGGFIWDDDSYVQENQTLRSADGLRQIWFEIGATKQYYPMVHTSYWLEYRLWQLNPTGYHVVNILLHALGALLLWRMLALLNVPGAWIASAVFALHPVHVESVAWITERKNVLSGLFYLSAAWAYLRYALPRAPGLPSGRSGRLYGAALFLFLCALLSKTVTSTFPAAMLLVLWWKNGRVRWGDVKRLLPFLIIGVALGLFTIWMEKHEVGAVGEEWHLTFIDRLLIAGRALCFYATKLVWPNPLIFIYPRWEIDSSQWWQYVYPCAVIAALAALWFARQRIGRGPLIATLFFCGTLVPALGFFDVFPMRFSFVADHFQYLASIGVIASVVGLGFHAAAQLGKHGKRLAILVATVVLATLGMLTWQQCKAYANVETLWLDTLHKNPDVWLAHNNLGNLYERQGKLDQAVHHHRLALEARPQFASNMADSNYNLGNALAAQGKFDEAIHRYRQAVKINPRLIGAQSNLGNALFQVGKLDEAVRQYRRVLEINPGHASTNDNLIAVLMRQGRVDEAIIQMRQMVKLRPGDARAHEKLVQALISAGRSSEAIEHLRETLRLRPGWPRPMTSLVWILAGHPDPNVRDASEAVALGERAATITRHRDPTVLDALAAAYANAGRFEQAVTTAENAFDLCVAAEARNLAAQIGSRLRLYERDEPFRRRLSGQRATRP